MWLSQRLSCPSCKRKETGKDELETKVLCIFDLIIYGADICGEFVFRTRKRTSSSRTVSFFLLTLSLRSSCHRVPVTTFQSSPPSNGFNLLLEFFSFDHLL